MHTQHVSRAYKSQTSASSAASQWRLYRHDSRNEGRYSLFGRRGISIYVIQSLLSHGTVCINSVLGSTHNVLKKAVSSLGKKSRKLSFRFTVCLKQWGLDHQGRPWSLVLPIEATLPSVEKKKKKPEQLNQTKPKQTKKNFPKNSDDFQKPVIYLFIIRHFLLIVQEKTVRKGEFFALKHRKAAV